MMKSDKQVFLVAHNIDKTPLSARPARPRVAQKISSNATTPVTQITESKGNKSKVK